MTMKRLQASWHAVHHSYWSASFALRRRGNRTTCGLERPSAACQGMHVGVHLKPPRVLRCSTDGRAAGHGRGATPGRLACSASLALVSFYRVAAP